LQVGRRLPRAGRASNLSSPLPCLPPGFTLNFTGARADFWLLSLLFAMLLVRYKRSSYNHIVAPAPLAQGLRAAFPAALVLRSSLLASYRVSSLLSEVTGTDLKKSGLLCSIVYSATKNLAYLPCRLARDGSIFLFFSGGGVSGKICSLKHPQNAVFLAALGAVFAPLSSPLFQERFDAI